MTFTIARTNINLGAASARELNTNVTGRAKAVYAQACAFPIVHAKARQPQATVANDAGTEKWCGLNIFELVGYRIGERGWRDRIFRISTINTPAGKQRLFAQVFATGETIRAFATRAIKPRYTDSIA